MSTAPLPGSLLHTAHLLGCYRFVELSCAEVLGRRATSAKARVAGFFSGAAGAHAWRAGLFEERLPVSTTLPDPAALTRSPGRDFDAALALLGGLEDEEVVRGLVTVLYPALVDAWRTDADLSSAAGDAPLRRVLRRAGDDVVAVAAEGAALIAPGATADPALAGLASLRPVFF